MRALFLALALPFCAPAQAQTPPSSDQIAHYDGLREAAHQDDAHAIRVLVAGGADPDKRDSAGRTPAHVAAFASSDRALRALGEAGADMNALESHAYDVLTIAAVANDLALVALALDLGNRPDLVTSPSQGTALIAAAHLGHARIVSRLVAAGAPLDHVNNLGWTAVMEAVVLGNGGQGHIETVRALIESGADVSLADLDGVTPLEHAEARGYWAIADLMRGGGKIGSQQGN